MDVVQKNLLQRANEGKLGHFFIVSPPGRAKNPHKDLRNWCVKIVSEFFKAQGAPSQDLKNNEDVLIIDEAMINKKFYDQAFVSNIAQFLSYRPIKTDRKFVIIEDLTKMSSIHANKLLKVFEEPPVNATIFLLNPEGAKPIQTISSRSVAIRAELATNLEKADLSKWAKKLEKKDLHQFCDYFKTRPEDERDLARALLDRIGPDSDKVLMLMAQKYLKEQAVDSEYNHNSYSRLSQLREIYLFATAE